jgi:hypothetical protein
MTQTFIASTTVGSGGAASIGFSSIAQTYTDLTLVFSVRITVANAAMNIRFNNSATAVYSTKILIGEGNSLGNGDWASQSTIYNALVGARSDYTANTFSNGQIFIPNYANGVNKVLSMDSTGENQSAVSRLQIATGIWANTAAITQIAIIPESGSIAEFSTAYLYGTLKGSGGATVS